MLSRDGVIARFILAFCFFFLSGSEMITGTLAAISGILGSIELATGLLRYSPLYEIYEMWQAKSRLESQNHQ
ncbi:MAG: YgaP-like transmembrane domain [Syntrophomonas sp.]